VRSESLPCTVYLGSIEEFETSVVEQPRSQEKVVDGAGGIGVGGNADYIFSCLLGKQPALAEIILISAGPL
jgi:hypothetical protein